jgi:hypothetical protein
VPSRLSNWEVPARGLGKPLSGWGCRRTPARPEQDVSRTAAACLGHGEDLRQNFALAGRVSTRESALWLVTLPAAARRVMPD